MQHNAMLGLQGKEYQEVQEFWISTQRSWECLRHSSKSVNRVWGRMKAQAGSAAATFSQIQLWGVLS